MNSLASIYHIVGLAGYAMSIVFFLLAVIMFFAFDIRSIIQMRLHYIRAGNKAAAARKDPSEPTSSQLDRSGPLLRLFRRKKESEQEEERITPEDYKEEYIDRLDRREDDEPKQTRIFNAQTEDDDEGTEDTNDLAEDDDEGSEMTGIMEYENRPAADIPAPANDMKSKGKLKTLRKIKVTHTEGEDTDGTEK